MAARQFELPQSTFGRAVGSAAVSLSAPLTATSFIRTAAAIDDVSTTDRWRHKTVPAGDGGAGRLSVSP